MLMTEMTSCNF